MIKAIQLFLLMFVVCVSGSAAERVDSLMAELKRVIKAKDSYVRIKLDKIATYCAEADSAQNIAVKFDAVGHLYDEYRAFNSDSAMKMCEERVRLAKIANNQVFIDNAELNMAEILLNAGMYKESLDILESVPSSRLPDYLLPYYYHIYRTTYALMRDYALRPSDINRYDELTSDYRDSIMSVNEPGTIAYVITYADKLNSQHKYAESIDLITEFFESVSCTEHDRAICAYSLAESYLGLGDTVRYKEQLLISSISDIKSAVREYVSLRELAYLLYTEGNVEDAYQFVRIAMDDAVNCNARIRVLEINKVFPIINKVYLDSMHRQQTRQRLAIVVISLLLIGLAISMVYLYKQMKRVAQARKEIVKINYSLRKLNSDLKESNDKLIEANNSIVENSRLKEAYIAQYMEQSSEYIEKMDRYRMTLRNLINSGKIAEVTKELKSTTFLDNELKDFYQSFDETFLRLFPTFVEDFNKLLQPGQEILPKKPKQLTTELRIFALIRLGITDSTKISGFLRYSLSTIYNYRTKVRNKAAGDRDRLEEELMKLG